MDDFLSGKANVGASYTKTESDDAYLSIGGKAADSELLDGNDSAYFATQSGLDTTDANLGALSTDLSTNYYTKTFTDDTFALITALNNAITRIDALEQEVTQLKKPDCPLGYERSMEGGDDDYTVCKKGSDEIVKVGDFWIDRYEIIIVDAAEYDGGLCDGFGSVGTIYGRTDGDAHAAGFYRNGMDDPTADSPGLPFMPLYACSVPDVEPSRWITWFQAQRACDLAGKHLCTNAEWQGAAYGTPDDSTSCNISTGGPENGGNRTACISYYGAYDMVGNLWEWTSNWWGQGENSDDGNQSNDGEFHGDVWWNVDNAQSNGSATVYTDGVPVFPPSALRGGAWSDGSGAGVFALGLDRGPSSWDTALGARCCRR